MRSRFVVTKTLQRTSAPSGRWSGPALLIALATLASGASGAQAPPDLLDPDLDVRSLPSLVVRWTCNCNPAGATVGPAPGGGAVYVQGYRRFFALDAETHDVLWDHKIESSGRALAPPLLLDDRLAVVYADRLFLVEPVSGVIVAEVELEGRIDRAVGPPLTVAYRPRSEDTRPLEREIVRIDEASGRVLVRRRLEILDLEAEDGRVLAVRAVSPPPAPAADPPSEPDRLLELSPDDLATLRSWPGAGAHFLDPSRGEGGLRVPFERTDDGPRYVRLEALGEHGPGEEALEAPRPYDGWSSLDPELRVKVPRGGAQEEPAALRRVDPRTGETLWTRLLPHRVRATLWDGGRILVHTRPRDGGRGLLVGLDAETGEVLTAAYGLAGVRSLERWGDLLIAVAAERVVAFEADAFGPPEAQVRPVAEEVDRLLARLEGRRAPRAHPDVFQELDALGPDAHPLLLARLPALAPQAALTVAGVLGQAGYEPAAPRLAELLLEFPDPPEDAPDEWHHSHPKAAILRHLAPVAGEDQLPAIGAVLLDDEEAPQVHEQALAALAEIGTPEVLPWLERFYGLTDQAEGRLATDPERPDTDGDGRPDALDPAPRGGAEPETEEERIRRAVVRHYAAFRKRHESGPFCVISERPLEWSGRGFGKILLPVRPGSDPEVHRRCQTLAARPATDEEAGQSREQLPELEPDDRLWLVTERSEHFAEAHWVVLRSVAGRWLVRRMTMWWIT